MEQSRPEKSGTGTGMVLERNGFGMVTVWERGTPRERKNNNKQL